MFETEMRKVEEGLNEICERQFKDKISRLKDLSFADLAYDPTILENIISLEIELFDKHGKAIIDSAELGVNNGEESVESYRYKFELHHHHQYRNHIVEDLGRAISSGMGIVRAKENLIFSVRRIADLIEDGLGDKEMADKWKDLMKPYIDFVENDLSVVISKASEVRFR